MRCDFCGERIALYDKIKVDRGEGKSKDWVYHAHHDISVETRLETALK